MSAQIIVSICSLIVAVAALTFSVISFRRQQARAERQARVSVTPILTIRSQTYGHLKSIRLINAGVGPAIIKKAEFRRGAGAPTNSIKDLFDLGAGFIWEQFVSVVPDRVIPAEGEMTLIKESVDHIKSFNVDEAEAFALLRNWQQQKSGIVARIEYEDIYGNAMPVLEETLK